MFADQKGYPFIKYPYHTMHLPNRHTGFPIQTVCPKRGDKSGMEIKAGYCTCILFQPERQQPYGRAGLATAMHGNKTEYNWHLMHSSVLNVGNGDIAQSTNDFICRNPQPQGEALV